MFFKDFAVSSFVRTKLCKTSLILIHRVYCMMCGTLMSTSCKYQQAQEFDARAHMNFNRPTSKVHQDRGIIISVGSIYPFAK